jgi:hypothetical protein
VEEALAVAVAVAVAVAEALAVADGLAAAVGVAEALRHGDAVGEAVAVAVAVAVALALAEAVGDGVGHVVASGGIPVTAVVGAVLGCGDGDALATQSMLPLALGSCVQEESSSLMSAHAVNCVLPRSGL